MVCHVATIDFDRSLAKYASKPRKRRVNVQREPRKAGASLVLTLSLPPSANNLFPSVRSKTGKVFRVMSKEYKEWCKLEDCRAPQAAVVTPCRVDIEIRPGSDWRYQSDVANREKATVDYLVRNGVIESDNSRHVVDVRVWLGEKAERETVLVVTVTAIASAQPTMF